MSFLKKESSELRIETRMINFVSPSNILLIIAQYLYGTQKRLNLTGAVAFVSSDVFAGIPVTNAGQLLNGRVSGVSIALNSGRTGDDFVRFRIRGFETLNNRSPLVLIDGIEGNIGELDPNQIESISALKYAAAGAIYGIRAANGVVLVTANTNAVWKWLWKGSGSMT